VVPDNQIMKCERWSWERPQGRLSMDWTYANARFTQPEQLSNVRELI
jgi:hypothetical protein